LDPGASALKDHLYKKAYSRLMQMVKGETSQLGASFAERKQAYSAINAHVKQLTTAVIALKRRDFRGFLGALGIKKRTIRKTASDAGGLWLEYSYGWKPLVEDIYNAVNVLQKPWPYRVCTGKAQGQLAVKITSANQYGHSETNYLWTLRIRLQTTIALSNWTAWQANELGLTNPASIAWEVVPFSFVVDWFLPIGQYLESLTDFMGLSQKNAFSTYYGQVDRTDQLWYYIPSNNHWRRDRRVNLDRYVGPISVPKLISRFTGFYSARGANAIALLCSQLRDLPKVNLSRREHWRQVYLGA
jgi:hypothetical protein